MRSSDWSSDVCSSDLIVRILGNLPYTKLSDIPEKWRSVGGTLTQHHVARAVLDGSGLPVTYLNMPAYLMDDLIRWSGPIRERSLFLMPFDRRHSWVDPAEVGEAAANIIIRSEEHTSELPSLMRLSYAVFCLKKTQKNI